MKRTILRLQDSEPVTDGDGVKIQRSVARGAPLTFDPFLLLDEIASDEAADYIGGFPMHPHRGFATVTYMLAGSMRHRDHMGNEGVLVPGGVQWMTAGRGVLHSELPEQSEGRLHGFQLWVNLPAAEKMQPPAYREFAPDDIPEVRMSAGSSAWVIAGEFVHGETSTFGPVQGVSTHPDYFDVALSAGETLVLPVDPDKRVVLYAYAGTLGVRGEADTRRLAQQQFAVLGEGDTIEVVAEQDSRFLLLAGFPLREPVASWGPFVMNTPEEIEQAISDFRDGNLVSEEVADTSPR